MTINLCDKCQTELNSYQTFRIGEDFSPDRSVSLCETCFRPYLLLLDHDDIVPSGLQESATQLLKEY